MIRSREIAIASAPMRISLAGGGTDLPSYAGCFGGTVVSFAIDRHVTVAASGAELDDSLFDLLGDGERMDHGELTRSELVIAAIRRTLSLIHI